MVLGNLSRSNTIIIIRTKFGIRLPSPLRGFAQILQVIPHLCMGRNGRLTAKHGGTRFRSRGECCLHVCERYIVNCFRLLLVKPFVVAPRMYVIAGGSSGSTWPKK